MGGEIDRTKLCEFSWELHVSELKFELQSNIIPIGKIQRGIHYHRALLFKVSIEKNGKFLFILMVNHNFLEPA